jgi:hypothetical protein
MQNCQLERGNDKISKGSEHGEVTSNDGRRTRHTSHQTRSCISIAMSKRVYSNTDQFLGIMDRN